MVEEDRIGRDRRGRAMRLLDYEKLTIDRDHNTAFIFTSLLNVVYMGVSSKTVLQNALSPIFTHAEPHYHIKQGTFYSCFEGIVSNFFSQCGLSLLSMPRDPSKHLEEMKFSIASEGEVLRKRFKSVCKQVVRNRKKHI